MTLSRTRERFAPSRAPSPVREPKDREPSYDSVSSRRLTAPGEVDREMRLRSTAAHPARESVGLGGGEDAEGIGLRGVADVVGVADPAPEAEDGPDVLGEGPHVAAVAGAPCDGWS